MLVVLLYFVVFYDKIFYIVSTFVADVPWLQTTRLDIVTKAFSLNLQINEEDQPVFKDREKQDKFCVC